MRIFGVVFVNQLREPQPTSHPRRPAADDDHIRKHLRTFNAFESFAKHQHRVTAADFAD
jgi:hypothetical protein